MNSPFTTRQQFIHIFQTGTILQMKVDITKHEVRFAFEWKPPLQNKREFEEILPEMRQWRDWWLGGEFGPQHNMKDFMLYSSCQSEIEQRMASLPP